MLIKKTDWGYEIYSEDGKTQHGLSVGTLPISFDFTEAQAKELDSKGELKVERREGSCRVLHCKKETT